jgi:hypothetical protein
MYTGRHFQNGRHYAAQIQHCPISMLNLCGIVAAILKMGTGRNFSMSGIISGHHNLPTYSMYEMSLKWPPQYRKNSTLFYFKGSF